MHANRLLPDIPDFLRLIRAGRADEVSSFRRLLGLAQRYAALYRGRGLEPGDTLAIVLPHSLDLYAAFAGALLGGFLPSIWSHPSPKTRDADYAEQLAAQLRNAQPRLLVTYTALSASLPESSARCTPEDVPPEAPPLPPFEPPDADAVAFLQYSSGTTGLKKGVAITHRALLWQVDTYAEAIQLREDDRIASWLPLYHDMGLICCLMLPLVHRVPVVAMSPFEWVLRPGMWLRAASEHGATLAWLPNFAYAFLATSVPDAELAGVDLSLLRGVVNCSEPILAQSHDEFLRRFGPLGLRPTALCGSYALAENTFAVTSGGFDIPLREEWVDGTALARDGYAAPAAPSQTSARRLVSSGRPLPQTKVEIVDGRGRALPDRRVGEIVIQSPCLLREYHRNPEATRNALRGGRYFTGDVGYLAGGELFVTGRRNDMIIVRGQNLFPQDVEAIVNGVPGVIAGRVAAIGVRNEALGTEDLALLVESHQTEDATRRELAEEIRRRVFAATDVPPRDVRVLPHMWLRKSTAGKISREINKRRYLELLDKELPNIAVACRTDAAAASDAGGAAVTAAGAALTYASAATTQRARACVRRALTCTDPRRAATIRDDEPLITSGIVDSLGLVALLNEIEAEFGISVPAGLLANLHKLDTVESLARSLDELVRRGDRTRDSTDRDAAAIVNAIPRDAGDIELNGQRPRTPRNSTGVWSWYYRLRLRRLGVRVGRGLIARGPLLLRFDGDARNVRIGDNVTLMPWVDLKVRERGRIVLHDGVTLDTNVRLVAARDARIELGDDVQIGIGSVINAGTDVIVGRSTAVAGYCTILASEHRYESRVPVLEQGYRHEPVLIGREAWVAAGAVVARGSRIGDGAVIAAQSFVRGDVPAYAVVAGRPARVIRYRA